MHKICVVFQIIIVHGDDSEGENGDDDEIDTLKRFHTNSNVDSRGSLPAKGEDLCARSVQKKGIGWSHQGWV